MALIQTSDLTGPALDWAVAKALRLTPIVITRMQWNGNLVDSHIPHPFYEEFTEGFEPSTNWSQGAPIIERESICLRAETSGGWYAVKMYANPDAGEPFRSALCWDAGGKTALEAAMRCYVAAKLGAEIEVPGELLGAK